VSVLDPTNKLVGYFHRLRMASPPVIFEIPASFNVVGRNKPGSIEKV
jgi:hypothetical protein